MSEQVLVCPKEFLKEFLTSDKLISDNKAVKQIVKVLVDAPLFYMDRDRAETDTDHLQIIPYVVLMKAGNDDFWYFRYQRTKKAGDARLRGDYSIGIGGHINPPDGDVFKRSYEESFRREIFEEIGLRIGEIPKIYAAIYDDSNDVGKVHLGLVHLLSLPNWLLVNTTDEALSNGEFVKYGDLEPADGKLENWSQLLFDNLLY